MKTRSRTHLDKASTPAVKKNGRRYSLAAMVARLTGLNRRYQDAGFASAVKPRDDIASQVTPANTYDTPTAVLDDDQLERTDFFACLARNRPSQQ